VWPFGATQGCRPYAALGHARRSRERCTTEMTRWYLVVDDKRAAAAEAADGGQGVLHVGTDEVNVVDLEASDQGIRK